MGFPMMTPYLLMVAITCPLTVVLATAGVSAAISRPGPKGGRNPVEGKALAFYGETPYPVRGCAMHCANGAPSPLGM